MVARLDVEGVHRYVMMDGFRLDYRFLGAAVDNNYPTAVN